MKTNKDKTERTDRGRMSRSAKIVVMICALLGALILWIYAIGYDSTIFERSFDGIEVVITGEDELEKNHGFTLAQNQYFSSVTIVASGKRSELNELKNSDFTAVVDVSSVSTPGDTTLPIVIYSPNGIEISSQSSKNVNVFIDEFTQKPQLLTVAVETGSGYIMSEGIESIEAVANPMTVTVSGPKSVLDTVAGAFVRFDLDGVKISGSLNGFGKIELRGKDGSVIENPYIKISKKNAQVAISVKGRKTVPVKVKFVGKVFDAQSITYTQSVNSITVVGSPELLAGFDEIVLNIDETTVLDSKDFEFQVSSLLPAGTENESGVSKIKVSVILPKMASRKYRVPDSQIEFVHLPEDSKASLTEKFRFTVVGAREAIEKINAKNIRVKIDFDKITVNEDGSYSALPEISLGTDMSGMYILNSGEEVRFIIEGNAMSSNVIEESTEE